MEFSRLAESLKIVNDLSGVLSAEELVYRVSEKLFEKYSVHISVCRFLKGNWVPVAGYRRNSPFGFGEHVEPLKVFEGESGFEGVIFPIAIQDSEKLLLVVEGLDEKSSHYLVSNRNYLFEIVRNVGVVKSSQNMVRLLAGVLEVARITGREIEIDEVIKNFISSTKELLEVEAVSVILIDEETGDLYFREAVGEGSDKVKEIKIPRGHGIAWFVVNTGESVVVNDVEKDPRFYSGVDKKAKYKTRNLMAVPLMSVGRTIGVVEAINKISSDRFSDKDLRVLELVAKQIAMHISNALLYAKVKNMFMNTITALVKAVDAKDPYTRGHSERVRDYSVLIGRSAGLGKKDLRNLELSALLHDIGKIGIDDRVLKKAGRLTDEEYEIIKKHPVIGAEILSSIPEMKDVIPGVRHHHEKWNGKGYPDGLKGKEIPLNARIIAIADTYDAMTSTRVYRPALSPQMALDEIKKFSGIQFDPELSNVFISSMKKILDKVRA